MIQHVGCCHLLCCFCPRIIFVFVLSSCLALIFRFPGQLFPPLGSFPFVSISFHFFFIFFLPMFSSLFLLSFSLHVPVVWYASSHILEYIYIFFSFFSHTSTFQLLDKPWSRCRPFSPVLAFNFYFLRSIFIPHRVAIQQSHCSSIFHRVLLTHALAFSASQLVPKKKSPRIMHSGGFELTQLTYTRLEDNLIRHRGDRPAYVPPQHASRSA